MSSVNANMKPGRIGKTLVSRIILAAILSLAVTLSLLWSMQFLIATADRSLDESVAGYIVDFVRLKREELAKRKSLKPEKPPIPKAPPPEPPKPQLDDVNPQTEKIAISSINVDAKIDLSAGGFSLNIGEGEYLPIVKVAPVYPQRALSRGIEGYVLLSFSVTRQGSVTNVTVIESKPTSSIFHRAAIKAAKKFKYKPRIVDGEAVQVDGVRNLIRFKLEKE